MHTVVTLDGVTIGSHAFVGESTLFDWKAILGNPDRIVDPVPPAPAGYRNNQIHMYDGLGVYLNEHHQTRLVQAITFVFWPEEEPFTPAAAYCGELLVGDLAYSTGMTESQCLRSHIPFVRHVPGIWSAKGAVWIGFTAVGKKRPLRHRGKMRFLVELTVCFG